MPKRRGYNPFAISQTEYYASNKFLIYCFQNSSFTSEVGAIDMQVFRQSAGSNPFSPSFQLFPAFNLSNYNFKTRLEHDSQFFGVFNFSKNDFFAHLFFSFYFYSVNWRVSCSAIVNICN